MQWRSSKAIRQTETKDTLRSIAMPPLERIKYALRSLKIYFSTNKVFCLHRVYVGDEVKNGNMRAYKSKSMPGLRISYSKRLFVQKYI